MPVRRFSVHAGLVLLVLTVACAAPPSKEIDQAQGAIDAARAAGADRYATTEYTAASEALKNANAAVTARDYRLALNYALESREHAQYAARDAAEAKAQVRAEVERTTTSISALLATTRTRLTAVRATRIDTAVLEQAESDIAAAEAALQESGEAVTAGDYLGANQALEGVREQVARALAALNSATPARRVRR
jgi:hypothetical protein